MKTGKPAWLDQIVQVTATTNYENSPKSSIFEGYFRIKRSMSMVERIPMSVRGHQKLKEELEHLERVERHAVVKAIEVAREHGDLKENAEYHAAKERQGMIEGRIMELKDKLGRAEVIDCSTVSIRRAVFGTVVSLMDLDTDEEITYQLLGPEEADVKKGSISVLSPLGRSILGKEEGDEVIAKTPGGTREFEIVEINSSPHP
jgi:transcription elongation factor GreA